MKRRKRASTKGGAKLVQLLSRFTEKDISAAIPCTEQSLQRWMETPMSPNRSTRLRLLQLYGIPEKEWREPNDEPLFPPPPPPPKNFFEAVGREEQALVEEDEAAEEDAAELPAPEPSERIRTPEGASALEQAKVQLERLKARLAKLEREDAGVAAIMAVEKVLMQALTNYSKLSGERDLTESMIVRSAVWQKVLRIFTEALTPFPEAAKAIADHIRGLGEDGR